MKIPTVVIEMFQTEGRKDGRTNMTMSMVAFRNFVKAPKHTTYKHKTQEPKPF